MSRHNGNTRRPTRTQRKHRAKQATPTQGHPVYAPLDPTQYRGYAHGRGGESV